MENNFRLMKYIFCFLIFNLIAFTLNGQETNALNVGDTTNNQAITNNLEDEPAILQDIRNIQDQSVATNSSMFIRSIFGFIVTLIGLYFVYMFFKKKNKHVLGNDGIIKVLATTTVAPNRFISVVEIVDELYLIAVADHNITLLSKIEEKDTKDQIKMAHALSKQNIVEDNFKNILDGLMSRFKQTKIEEKSPLDSTQEIKDRLNKLKK